MNIAIVGATGEVGRTVLRILEERRLEPQNLYLLASARSAGSSVTAFDREYPVSNVDDFDPALADFAIFSAGAEASGQYAPKFADAGCIVIDNSSRWRSDPDVPLVVPEVNRDALEKHKNIIANPNCSTIQLVVALKPIDDAAGIERIDVATYQAVSGAGRKGIDALVDHRWESAFAQPIDRNVVPQVDKFEPNGYTKEELKVVNESRKILARPDLRVNCTAVRVPVLNGHSLSVNIETHSKLNRKEAIELLKRSPGIVVLEDPDFPTALKHADGRDEVFVGRIREDLSLENGLNLWVVADNLRKGAALNAIQIFEVLVGSGVAR